MVLFEMQWKNRWKDSGWVAQIKGIKSDGSFLIPKSNYLIPQGGKDAAAKRNLAIFELIEGPIYMFDNTGARDYSYAKVENGVIMELSRDDVVALLEQDRDSFSVYNAQSRTIKPKNPHNGSQKKGFIKLSKEVEFIIDNLGEAFKILEEKNVQPVFQGMLLTSWRFAETFELTKEWKEVQDAFSSGSTIEEIKKMFEPPTPSANSYFTNNNSFNLSDYNVPISV